MKITLDIPNPPAKQEILEIPLHFCGGKVVEAGGFEFEERKVILDKIRAEIQRLRGCSCSCSDGIIDDVEDIIDKYKAESEEGAEVT